MNKSLKNELVEIILIEFLNDIKTHHKEAIVEVTTGMSKIIRKKQK